MFLQRLVFYSENKIKELGLPFGKEMLEIATSGERDFPAAGITGTLIFNEQIFVGVLEGDRRRLSAALLRIARDRRTACFTMMEFSAITTRIFLDWTTVYAGHTEDIDRLYLKHGIAIGLDPSRMTAQQVVPLAEAMAAIHRLSPAPMVFREAATPQSRENGVVIRVTNTLVGLVAQPAPPTLQAGLPQPAAPGASS